MPSNSVPKLTRHKRGLGVVRLSNQDHYCGPWPASAKKPPPAVQAEYDRVVAEWIVNGRRPLRGDDPLTINELIVQFWQHAERHYRDADGNATSELADYKHSLRPLQRLYGDTSAADFGPKSLKALRAEMVKLNWCRSLVNQRIGRVRRVFRWASSEELVPVAVFEALRTVQGLQRGRCDARETEPVKPVAVEHVEAVLPLLTGPLQAVVRLQQYTGCRPGEALAMRPAYIDRTGPVWVYEPVRHKTGYRGKRRRIFLGPKAQAIIAPFLQPLADLAPFVANGVTADVVGVVADFLEELGRPGVAKTLRTAADQAASLRSYLAGEWCLFRPSDAMTAFRAGQRAARKTKVQPSQVYRAKAKPKKRPGEEYHHTSFARAVAAACKRSGVPHWHPNQLRHNFATEVRKVAGIDVAGTLLGHSELSVTAVYAERDEAKAAEVAARIG